MKLRRCVPPRYSGERDRTIGNPEVTPLIQWPSARTAAQRCAHPIPGPDRCKLLASSSRGAVPKVPFVYFSGGSEVKAKLIRCGAFGSRGGGFCFSSAAANHPPLGTPSSAVLRSLKSMPFGAGSVAGHSVVT